MNWILDHLQIVIAVAAAIAYWINQRAREKAGKPADYDEDGVPERRRESRVETRELAPANRDGTDFDQEERARRIREEIQRKIAERRGQASAPAASPAVPPPMPRLDPFRPVFQEESRPLPPPLRPAERSGPPPLRPAEPADVRQVATFQDDSAALERQRRLAEQLEELEERRRQASQLAGETRGDAGPVVVTAVSAGAPLAGRGVAAELRDPRALRRAFVLREVISAPVALR